MATLGCVLSSAAVAEDAIAVLTPATPDRWYAGRAAALPFLPEIPVNLRGYAAGSELMQGAAHEDAFDLAERLQRVLVGAFEKRGTRARRVVIDRPPQTKPSPVSRDRLPDSPGAPLLLDVTVDWFGLFAPNPLDFYRPYVGVGYRVLDGRGGPLRPALLVQYGAMQGRRGVRLTADPDCVWPSMDAVQKDRARVWGCFDAALEGIAEHVVEQVASLIEVPTVSRSPIVDPTTESDPPIPHAVREVTER